MEPVKPTISVIDAHNQLLAQIRRNDEKLEDLFEQVQTVTCELGNPAVDDSDKFDSIVSCEYLLVRARFLSNFEQLKIKAILADPDTPASLRAQFMKRDQYLAQVSLKLNEIRDDLSVIQKSVWAKNNRNLFNK